MSTIGCEVCGGWPRHQRTCPVLATQRARIESAKPRACDLCGWPCGAEVCRTCRARVSDLEGVDPLQTSLDLGEEARARPRVVPMTDNLLMRLSARDAWLLGAVADVLGISKSDVVRRALADLYEQPELAPHVRRLRGAGPVDD